MPSGNLSWRSTPPCGTRQGGLGRRYTLPTRPISGRTRNCGASGCKRESLPPFPRGQALVDSSSPRYGEKASYYSAVCLETGEVKWMDLEGNSNSQTSTAFLT